MKDGMYYLNKYGETLAKLAECVARTRYEGAPDLDDRIGDALLALTEAAHRFQPRPGKNGLGYFLQYVLSAVAGAVRNGASRAKRWSDEAAVFTDAAPNWLDSSPDVDLEHVLRVSLYEREDAPDVAQENLWRTKKGHVYDTLQVVKILATDYADWTARKLGVPNDEQLPVRVLQALDALAEQTSVPPAWIGEPTSPKPMAADLPDVTVRRQKADGTVREKTVPGEAYAAAVNQASANGAIWMGDEEPEPTPVWLRDWEEQKKRPVGAMAADRNHWPACVTKNLWVQVIMSTKGKDVADVLADLEAEDTDAPVFSPLQYLRRVLADVDDNQVRLVVRALVNRLRLSKDEDVEALYDAFGVDGPGWQREETSVAGLTKRAIAWLDKLAELVVTREQFHGMRQAAYETAPSVWLWPSQYAAIEAIIKHGASPYEAKAAARRAYAGN